MSCSTQKNIAATILILACGAPAAARDNPLVLEEVIVTAQKRVETLADTPMTLNVLSGAQIADSASFGLTDLDKLTSGLAIEGSGFGYG